VLEKAVRQYQLAKGFRVKADAIIFVAPVKRTENLPD
jgi:hypothetical protein